MLNEGMKMSNTAFIFLSLAGKGFWSEMLGVGDFYYELGVQIIEVCLALKHRNGGKDGWPCGLGSGVF